MGKERLKWETPEDLGGYDNTIQAKDTTFDQSKSEKKHVGKLIECEKLLEGEENLPTLILQAVDEPLLGALKDENIRYGG